MLCEALLKAYDGAVGREHRRGGMAAKHEQLISVALGILLACSTSAKQSALKCKSQCMNSIGVLYSHAYTFFFKLD